MNLSAAEGATPLDPDTLAGLIPDLATQEELNAFEQQNIALTVRWALRSRTLRQELLTAHGLRLLHQRMFDQTWQWAGRFRTVGTNIGVDWPQISVQVASLCADIAYQIAEGVGSPDEQALRLHHRLALTHPFPSGNGRHARLAADLLVRQQGRPLFSWGTLLGATLLWKRHRFGRRIWPRCGRRTQGTSSRYGALRVRDGRGRRDAAQGSKQRATTGGCPYP